MAEAARRYQQAGSSDLVRRLIARPVRLEQQARTRLPVPGQALPGQAVQDPRVSGAALDDLSEDFDEADEIARLETELQVMKAVLRAQRQEVEALRAQRQLLTESAASDDVRATRERWASLVDTLLIRAR
ncbi:MULTISPECIES: hypothetical protein [unclassified Methylobacterium]|uniref:hypothetical protein n=1 Tax=unclassified Methylobacterium TaxID=2615210 RepID=UPI0011C1D523|nr:MULTISPECIES: hypothetical protein [unclassified Methylobacterium]QEE38821.1 hypothetical protein FVA80_07440 [Methylobacterium sp. WL1]TXN53623.1 hypothetical protein FV241_27495 [Methylobacterium sp. WL2]